MTTSAAAVALARDLKGHGRDLVANRLRLDAADAVDDGLVTLRSSGDAVPKVAGVTVQPEDQVLVARTGERGEVVIGSVTSPGTDEPPGWYELSATAPDRSYLARLAGQWVYQTLDRIDPTTSAYGLADDASETDNKTVLMRAVRHAGEIGAVTRVPPGEYPLAGDTIVTDAPLEGAGPDRTIFTRSSGGSTPTLYAAGSLGAATSLSVDADPDDTTITTATDPGLAAGDLVHLTSTRTVGTSSGAVGYEMAWVESVSGSGPYTITLRGPLLHSFTTANASAVAKVTPARPRISGVGIRITGAAAARGIQYRYTDGGVVEGVAIDGYQTNGVDIRASVNTHVADIRIDDPSSTASGMGYGVYVTWGSRDGVVERVTGHNNRHLVIFGAAASCYVVRDSIGYNGQFGDFDLHGQLSRWIDFERCRTESEYAGFNAANTSYSWDADIRYIQCGGRGAVVGSSVGHFRFVTGATRIQVIDPQTEGGNAGLYLLGASEVAVRGGRLRNHTRGIDALDTTGVAVQGTVVDTSGSNAIRSQGTSDSWLIDGVQYVSCAAGSSLTGAANTVGTEVTR